MAEPLSDLSAARILVTNDDGITAPGIKLLERIARRLSRDVWVVAPETEQSAVAHSLTLRRPLRLRRLSPRRYAVDGTPTDCVVLAVESVLKGHPPDLVLSGINAGDNLADAVTYSGTIAAAMEAALLGLRAIALSQEGLGDRPPRWTVAERWAGETIARVAACGWPRNVLINVNFPDIPADKVAGIEAVPQGQRKIGDSLHERADPHGRPYYWIGAQRSGEAQAPGTDLDALARGAVTVTPLCLDLTDHATLAALRRGLA